MSRTIAGKLSRKTLYTVAFPPRITQHQRPRTQCSTIRLPAEIIAMIVETVAETGSRHELYNLCLVSTIFRTFAKPLLDTYSMSLGLTPKNVDQMQMTNSKFAFLKLDVDDDFEEVVEQKRKLRRVRTLNIFLNHHAGVALKVAKKELAMPNRWDLPPNHLSQKQHQDLIKETCETVMAVMSHMTSVKTVRLWHRGWLQSLEGLALDQPIIEMLLSAITKSTSIHTLSFFGPNRYNKSSHSTQSAEAYLETTLTKEAHLEFYYPLSPAVFSPYLNGSNLVRLYMPVLTFKARHFETSKMEQAWLHVLEQNHHTLKVLDMDIDSLIRVCYSNLLKRDEDAVLLYLERLCLRYTPSPPQPSLSLVPWKKVCLTHLFMANTGWKPSQSTVEKQPPSEIDVWDDEAEDQRYMMMMSTQHMSGDLSRSSIQFNPENIQVLKLPQCYCGRPNAESTCDCDLQRMFATTVRNLRYFEVDGIPFRESDILKLEHTLLEEIIVRQDNYGQTTKKGLQYIVKHGKTLRRLTVYEHWCHDDAVAYLAAHMEGLEVLTTACSANDLIEILQTFHYRPNLREIVIDDWEQQDSTATHFEQLMSFVNNGGGSWSNSFGQESLPLSHLQSTLGTEWRHGTDLLNEKPSVKFKTSSFSLTKFPPSLRSIKLVVRNYIEHVGSEISEPHVIRQWVRVPRADPETYPGKELEGMKGYMWRKERDFSYPPQRFEEFDHFA